MSKWKMQSFSRYTAFVVLIPARYFVERVLNSPENFSVFSRTVVTCGWNFRNFLAFSFFIIQRVFLGNFRITMFPMMSWGTREIFFLENFGMVDDRWWMIEWECFGSVVFFMVYVGVFDIKGLLRNLMLLLKNCSHCEDF